MIYKRAYKHYNVIQILPSLQIIYETKLEGFGFCYLDIDFAWLNFGVSFSLIKEK